MEIHEHLHTYDTNQQQCSVCGNRIPKEIQRISFQTKTRYGYSYSRVCGLCIVRLSKHIDKKAVNKWAKLITAKEI